MVRRHLATPVEQVSIEGPARRVRLLACAQSAIIAFMSMFAGMAAVLAIVVAPDDRPAVFGVLMGLVAVGGVAFGFCDMILGRSLARMVEGGASLRRAAADRASELARANAKLRQRDRQRSELFATMSHELRTPLNAILGYSRALLDGLDGDLNPAQRDSLRQIHNGGAGLLAIANGVLDLARLESGATKIKAEPVSAFPIVESVVALLRPLAHARGLTLTSDIMPDDSPVLADEGHLGQILVNLVGNAVKFTDDGSVVVRSRAENGMVTISVSDTGIGIPPKARDLIFEPLRQADQGDTRRHGGTGLGLAIVKQIVTMLGGKIGVESELGVGSTFHVSLPAAADALGAPTVALAPEISNGVLVVGDGAGPSALVRAIQAQGTDASLASGDSWRTILRRSRPKAVLIDVLRPRAGAWQVLAELRADGFGSDLPIGLYGVVDGRGHTAIPTALELLFESADEGELCARLEERFAADSARLRPSMASVLVVGEDDLWRGRILGLLRARGHRGHEIASAREALATLRNQRVSALVLDLLLPRPGVLAVLAAIADDDSLAHIPVVLIGPSQLSPVQQRDLYLAISGWVGESGRPAQELGEQVLRALKRATADLVPAGMG